MRLSSKKKFKKDGTKYKLMVAILSLVFLFFLSSRIIFNTPMKDEDTPIRKPIEVADNFSLEIASKEFYKNKNVLEIDVIVNEKGNGVPIDLGFKAAEKTDTKAKYKQEIFKITDEYYVIFVHGLPDKWRSVSLQFFDKNVKENGVKNVLSSSAKKVYVAKTSTESFEVFSQQKADFYEAKYIDILIKDAEKLIKDEEENIEKSNDDQKKMHERIESIKSDLEYKTESQKEEANQEITQLQSKINTFKNNNLKSAEVIKEQQEIIKKLTEKKGNLVY